MKISVAGIILFLLFGGCEIPTRPSASNDAFSLSYSLTTTTIKRQIPITITWSEITISRFKQFEIERAKIVGDTYQWMIRGIVTDSLATTFIDTIDDDVTFQYRVRIVDQNNQYKVSLAEPFTIPTVRSVTIPIDYSSIQEAFETNFIDEGDSIRVLQGSYPCSLNIVDKPISLYAPDGPDRTFLFGIAQAMKPVVTINCGDINAFTITGGKAFYGGGVLAEGNAVVRNCVISNNEAREDPNQNLPTFPIGWGGGVHARGEALIIDCEISNNLAMRGGGGIVLEENAQFIRGLVKSNRSRILGGGIYFHLNYTGDLTLCRIINNKTMYNITGLGGGIYSSRGDLTISNTVLAKNSAGVYGGGIYSDEANSIRFINCVFFRNSALNREKRSGAIGGSNPYQIMNSIVYKNSGPIENRLFGNVLSWSLTDQMSFAIGEGNLIGDPGFINTRANNYGLITTSPCIDAGNPDSQYNDPDGTRNDMGIFGGPGAVNP
ncbi:MAG: hypothetical protein ACE5D8_06315 [Fidelibacterota bacterium]